MTKLLVIIGLALGMVPNALAEPSWGQSASSHLQAAAPASRRLDP